MARRPLVLIAEDDQELLAMLGRLVSTFADVELATDGQQALEMVQAGLRPDLLLTDVMMPRMNGLTLVEQVKATQGLSRIPVIVLTAKSAPRDVIAGINAGARSYITKPFKQDELIGKVKKALRL
jgi:CheY-like chemotaxis protein